VQPPPPKTLAPLSAAAKSPGGFGLEAELRREATNNSTLKGDDAPTASAATPTKSGFGLHAEVGEEKTPLKVNHAPTRSPAWLA
jgi:hypothetical protein